MNIAEKIKAIREKKRIKQIEVANKLDLDPAYYARLEKRGEKLTIEQLKQIANALEVGINELLDIEVQPTDNEIVKELENKIAELNKLNTLFSNAIPNISKLLKHYENLLAYLIESELYEFKKGFKEDEKKISKFKDKQIAYSIVDCIVPNPHDVDLDKFPTTRALLNSGFINLDDFDFTFPSTKDILKIFKDRNEKFNQEIKSVLESPEWKSYVKENNL